MDYIMVDPNLVFENEKKIIPKNSLFTQNME